VGRFERDDNEAAQLPETLGVATEGLRSTIEVEVARIVDGAQARAAQIEDQALERANRLEQESDRRMGAVFDESRARLGVMFTQIDAVEETLGEAVRSLRAEAERLTADLGRAQTEPLEMTEPPAPPEEPQSAEDSPESPAPEAAAEEPPAAEPDASEPSGGEPDAVAQLPQAPDPAVRELIRQQLVSFAKDGRTRADAERMLLRFKQGDQYFDLLDDIYPDQTPGRRGLLRRRKKDD
jgi:hypothetical protein